MKDNVMMMIINMQVFNAHFDFQNQISEEGKKIQAWCVCSEV